MRSIGCTESFTATASTIDDQQAVCVRQTAAATPETRHSTNEVRRSTRYSSLPAAYSLTAWGTWGVTVPALGEGMRPLGPRTLPSLLITRIMSGLAMATSKSIQPFSISATSSSCRYAMTWTPQTPLISCSAATQESKHCSNCCRLRPLNCGLFSGAAT